MKPTISWEDMPTSEFGITCFDHQDFSALCMPRLTGVDDEGFVVNNGTSAVIINPFDELYSPTSRISPPFRKCDPLSSFLSVD